MSKFEARAKVSGSVRKVVAQVGDWVEAGKPVVIYIESMKMDIPVLSSDAGTVRGVPVAENELVESGPGRLHSRGLSQSVN